MELLALLPLWYQYLLVTLLGLIIGSFLNVVIYRLNTGRSLNGSSHCLSCQKLLRWYELFPVVSYLALRGRCAECGSFIPVRYVVVEAMCALLFLFVFSVIGLTSVLLLHFTLVALLLVIIVYDIRHYIIPDQLTLAVGGVAVLLVGVEVWQSGDSMSLIWSLVSSLCAFGFFAGLWKVSHGRWIGFGDAKLVVPLAFLLTPLATFSFIVLSFWVGAAISLLLLSVQQILKRGQTHLRFLRIPLTIKSEVPFAPFIVIAFLLTFYASIDVLAFFQYLM